jgi:hypothetical protein
MHYDGAEYRAILNSSIPATLMTIEAPGARFDSAEEATVFFARELDHVKAQSYDVEYPQFTALEKFPISTSVDAGAETITYYTYDKQGIAKVIDNYSTDLPRADVAGKPTTAQVKSLGVSYGYSTQEMRASRLAGKGLDARKAEAARYAIDNKTNIIAWRGDEESGLLGVLSTGQNIPLFTLTAGATSGKTSWLEKTADEILNDLTAMQMQVADTTNNVERPDTLCLPADVYMKLANTRIPDTSVTVLKYLLDNAPYIKDIISAAELGAKNVETNPYAKTDATGQRVAFLFTNSEKKLTLENPLPYQQYTAEVRGLETIVPCEARTGGVLVYYPMSALIAVGI